MPRRSRETDQTEPHSHRNTVVKDNVPSILIDYDVVIFHIKSVLTVIIINTLIHQYTRLQAIIICIHYVKTQVVLK